MKKIPQDLGFVDRTDPDKRFNLEIGDEVLKNLTLKISSATTLNPVLIKSC